MKQRAVDAFPVVLAAILPVAGIVLAGARLSEGDRPEAGRLAAAAALGALIWAIVLTS